jgi:rRNA-processing protein FCF1
MKKAILDTSFILTATRQKIDFFPELENTGFKILIPEGVIKEIEIISKSNKKSSLAENARLALKILEKENFEKIKLEGKNVDDSIVKLAKENSDFVVATLDKEIKDRVKNSKLVIKQKKRVELA